MPPSRGRVMLKASSMFSGSDKVSVTLTAARTVVFVLVGMKQSPFVRGNARDVRACRDEPVSARFKRQGMDFGKGDVCAF